MNCSLMVMPDFGSSPRACNARDGGGLGVAILAAGRSSRMGKPKMLLPWGGTTIIGHLADLWRELGAGQVAVVQADEDTALAAELERVGIQETDRIINPHPDRGMFSSIRCAARWPGWRPDMMSWVLVLGDQPQLKKETLLKLIAAGKDHPNEICMPSFAGHARHPVLMPKGEFMALAVASAATLKDFLEGRKQAWIEMDDPGLAMDIDTPDAYDRALRYCGHKS